MATRRHNRRLPYFASARAMHLLADMDDATMRDEMALERQFGDVDASLDRRFDSIDERFASIDKRFDKVESDIKLLAEGLQALDQKMDRRFDAMEAKFDDTIRWIKGILQNHEQRITTIEKRSHPPRRRS